MRGHVDRGLDSGQVPSNDGRVIERDVAETRVRLDGQSHTTIVVFGDEATDSLLGAYTLEGFGVAVDPMNRKLLPIPRFPMAGIVSSGNQLIGNMGTLCGTR